MAEWITGLNVEVQSSASDGSLWAESWTCPICHWHAEGEDFYLPLHNPLYCTGKHTGDSHVQMPMYPHGYVYSYTPYQKEDKHSRLVGRIKGYHGS